MPRRVAIVPHTHWDREWYESYQSFRMRLVDMLDRLIPILERDPSYARFMLDGQMAVVDDYLEVRPDAERRIRALAATGRLAMGPWYVLLDEFLVSGETIIRDLQMGIARGAAFGGVIDVGYLPDMFGHIAQMPQILQLAGFEHTVVWRGVPSAVEKSAFWWEAPDGSTVRAEYLMTGYGNGAAIGDDAKGLVIRIHDHIDEVGSFLIDSLLFMNGTDHQEPQAWLGRVVAEANDIQDDLQLEITSLPEYLADAPTDGLTRWRGELRSGFRANVLMGVASNRVDVKKSAATTERNLERRAEPFAALFQPAEDWPATLLEIAWRGVVRNSAHDSICACSVDDVVDAVLHRFTESRTIANGVAERALTALSRSFEAPGTYVLNPSARPRGGAVEAILPGNDVPEGTQVLGQPEGAFGIPRGLGAMTLDAGTVRTLISLLPSGSQINPDTWIQHVDVSEDDTGIDITIGFGPDERYDVPLATIKQDLYTRLGARPDSVVRVRIDQPVVSRVLARVSPVAGLGWSPFEVAVPDHPVTATGTDDSSDVVLSNRLLTVSVSKTDGTFALNGHPGFGALVDGGDYGDSYNYSPPRQDRLVTDPDSVTVAVTSSGPVEASVTVKATYTWPDHVDPMSQARVGEHTVDLTTTLTLRADESFVRVTTSFVNPSRDHRLRVHLPLPEPADHSSAECAFAVVRRGLVAEGRSDEFGLPTFPSRRFVSAGGLTVAHEGLLEYELVDLSGDGDSPDTRGVGDRDHSSAFDRDALATRYGIPAASRRTSHARRRPAVGRQGHRVPLRNRPRLCGPLRPRRRRLLALGSPPLRWRWDATLHRLRTADRRRRALRRAPRSRISRGPRLQSDARRVDGLDPVAVGLDRRPPRTTDRTLRGNLHLATLRHRDPAGHRALKPDRPDAPIGSYEALGSLAGCVALIPVKSFATAKRRLAPALRPEERAELARSMADRVLEATAPLPVAVVCDDPEVAAWALEHGALLLQEPGLGLNGAVTAGVDALARAGADEVLVVHADLPLASDLARFAGFPGVTLVPDRRDDGTNVCCVPAGAGFRFSYGPSSFVRHCAEADRLRLELRIVREPLLAWDIDLPDDLPAGFASAYPHALPTTVPDIAPRPTNDN